MKLQNILYSPYKRSTTLKGLVGVALNGVVTYVSKLYPRSNTDKDIVKDCGVLKQLVPGDLVLADKGTNERESLYHQCSHTASGLQTAYRAIGLRDEARNSGRPRRQSAAAPRGSGRRARHRSERSPAERSRPERDPAATMGDASFERERCKINARRVRPKGKGWRGQWLAGHPATLHAASSLLPALLGTGSPSESSSMTTLLAEFNAPFRPGHAVLIGAPSRRTVA
ncbi:hypothetical protein HPB47_026999 [Ixodes persulcatus]|uniref:Uncharacterized protein n=1 Tax=Ixodes persulcatus TaxID=34615 RepID=A0AC60PX28_IXOPE|nr:hypothetical protein HPB47_026999 [Ixodes persulcatus]